MAAYGDFMDTLFEDILDRIFSEQYEDDLATTAPVAAEVFDSVE